MVSEDEAVQEVYHPKDAVGKAIEATLILGAAGLTVSAIQNTLTKQNVSGWGVFTRTGGTIGMFGQLSWDNWSVCRRLTRTQLLRVVHTGLRTLQLQIYERRMIAGIQQSEDSSQEQSWG